MYIHIIYIHVYVCVRVCVLVCVCVCVCVYIYKYVLLYICTYMYIHIAEGTCIAAAAASSLRCRPLYSTTMKN